MMFSYETLSTRDRQNIDVAVAAIDYCAPCNREAGIEKIRSAFADAFGESAAILLICILRNRLALLHTDVAGNA
jgi:hypothetical protein